MVSGPFDKNMNLFFLKCITDNKTPFNLVSSDVIYSCLSGVHTDAFSLHMEVIKKTFTTE